MNMPCITKTAYYQQVETILDTLEVEGEIDMKQVGQRLRQHILTENGGGDVPQCSSDEEFEEWHTQNVASGDCDVNFKGSSPAMEAEGAAVLWNRSVEHQIQVDGVRW